MALSASGLAAAITAQQGTATDDPATQDQANLNLATAIVDYLTANATITVTLPSGAVATTGGPTSQVGPPAPVSLSGTIS